MATTRTRLTAEQKIAALNAKIKAIKEAERTAKKVKKPVLIRAIAKLTRSGLKIAE
jgi:hypothetical protein